MVIIVFLLVLLVSMPCLVVEASHDCQDFPFFDHPRWQKLSQDFKLVSEEYGFENYDFELHLPNTLEAYMPDKAKKCLEESTKSEEPFRFKIMVNMTSERTRWKHLASFECKYDSIRDVTLETSTACTPGNLFFLLHSCGVHQLEVTGSFKEKKEVNENDKCKCDCDDKFSYSKPIPIGYITPELPLYTRLHQMKNDTTSATLGFDPKIKVQKCLNRSYTVRCGNFTKRGLLESKELLVDNLFPGSNYSCSYQHEDLDDAQVVKFSTSPLNFSLAPFHVTDRTVSLDPDMFEGILDNQNMAVTLQVKELGTNQTHSAEGKAAVDSGVSGLTANTQYDACVQLKQLQSYYDNKNQTWCFRVKTLPPAPHSAGGHEGWVGVTVILSLVILCLVVCHLRRRDYASSVSDFASSIKAKLLKCTGEEES